MLIAVFSFVIAACVARASTLSSRVRIRLTVPRWAGSRTQTERETSMPPVDPNEVLMTGENSFIRLSPDGRKTQTDRKVRIYSDNIAVALWLQKTIETLLFPAFADMSLPVLAAAFERHGGPW